MQFERPPLLELVAEVKWVTDPSKQGPSIPSPLAPSLILATSSQEEFFSAFARESAHSGWTASERITQVGFPIVSYQPILRIRSFKDAESQMIYQIGAGIFSAHALPPYKNWESFRPFAERGLNYLLRTRTPDEQRKEFFSVTLRYLDLFTPDLIGDISVGKFLTEILGFSLVLPPVLQEQVKRGETAEPHLALRLPLVSGLEMRLNFGNSIVGDRKGIILDTAVSSNENIPASREAVLAVWEKAHEAIRKTFVGLTKKIHAAMKPIEKSL